MFDFLLLKQNQFLNIEIPTPASFKLHIINDPTNSKFKKKEKHCQCNDANLVNLSKYANSK